MGGEKLKSKIFLKKVKLEKYKCFENMEISFKDLTIIVGENNAGKSCLVEALRLIATAARQSKSREFKQAPGCLELPLAIRGFVIKVEKLKIDLEKAIYFYGDEAAKITAVFCDDWKIEIHVTKEVAFAVFYDSDGMNIKKRIKPDVSHFNNIAILPQIGLIRDNERLLSTKTVEEDKDTYLTSLHFRNEIFLHKEEFFEEFKKLSETTWFGLEINEVEYNYGTSEYLEFFLKDNSFPAEIADMGSGIKMWLQIMWFLARTKNNDIIILDEPDVYMHADLQRKLLDIVKMRYPQVIIATHSLEIIGRVEPENIVSVNKKDKQLRYATDSSAVQNIVDNIGGIHNLSLIRLGLARKCLFVEGKDLPYLNRFNEILYGKKIDLPILEYGGFSKLSNTFGASNLLFSESKGNIKCYALADRDYRTDDIVDQQIKEATKQHLELHIWEKKEIENYLIDTKVLYRIVERYQEESYEDFCGRIEELVEGMKDLVIDGYADMLQQRNRGMELSTCNIKAREIIKNCWGTLESKISLVNGKDLLAKIREYCQSKYKVTLTDNLIQKSFTMEDVPMEIKTVLAKVQ